MQTLKPLLFELSDGRITGLSEIGWIAFGLLMWLVAAAVLTFLFAKNDGYIDGDGVAAIAVISSAAAAVMTAVFVWIKVAVWIMVIVAPVLLVLYAAYRIGVWVYDR